MPIYLTHAQLEVVNAEFADRADGGDEGQTGPASAGAHHLEGGGQRALQLLLGGQVHLREHNLVVLDVCRMHRWIVSNVGREIAHRALMLSFTWALFGYYQISLPDRG